MLSFWGLFVQVSDISFKSYPQLLCHIIFTSVSFILAVYDAKILLLLLEFSFFSLLFRFLEVVQN